MSKKDQVNKRPATNDSVRRDNDDLDDQAARWDAWRRQQAKRRGEIAAANQAPKK